MFLKLDIFLMIVLYINQDIHEINLLKTFLKHIQGLLRRFHFYDWLILVRDKVVCQTIEASLLSNILALSRFRRILRKYRVVRLVIVKKAL